VIPLYTIYMYLLFFYRLFFFLCMYKYSLDQDTPSKGQVSIRLL
jgi:hypothetical protein